MSKGNRTRTALGREEIARAALEMLDEEGVQALTMRRLADRLGAGTMTLYGYFRSKQELLDAAVGAAVEDFHWSPDTGGSLRDRLRAHQKAVREMLLVHPALPQLRAHQPMVQPAAFRLSEPAMRMLLDAGFPPEEAARTFRVLFVYVLGSMLFGPDELTAEQRRGIKAALLLLPDDEFPAIARMPDELAASMGGEVQFDYGLDLILDGIEARAARHSAASSHQ